MKPLGIVTSVLLGALAVIAIGVGLRSVPDVRRYLKIRKM
jgi:hypothetical protein